MQTGFDIWRSWWMWLLTNSAYASLLIMLVMGAQWLFHKQLPARWRYGLWWLVLLRLALPILPESPVSIFNLIRFEAGIQSSPVSAVAPRNIVEMPQIAYHEKVALAANPLPTDSGQPVREITATAVPKTELWRIIRSRQSLAAFWLVGVILLVGRVLREQIRWVRQTRTCIPVTQPAVIELLKECQLAMGLTRPLVILETRLVSSPALHGLFRPQLLLPTGFTERFSLRDLRYVFPHELAHVKRRDIAVNWLATGLQILHWFNPLVWLAFSRMRADRELACDAMALSVTDPGENRAYGQTIIRLLEGFVRPTTMPGLIGILEANSHMKRRMAGIARFKKASRISVLAALIVIALGVVSLTNARSRSQPAETMTENMGGGTVIGRVVDDRGEPIKNVGITQKDGVRTFTDQDGRFTFTNAPAGARYRFSRDPLFCLRDQLLKGRGEQQTIVMRDYVDISCRVLDAGTGKSIPSFWLVPGRGTSWQWNQRMNGTNGAYVFRIPAFPLLKYFPEKLMAGAQGYSPAVSARLNP